MVCIYCKSKTQTTNSRSSGKTLITWRRKHCPTCHATFTTRETPDLSKSLRFKDGSGALQGFSRDALLISVNGSVSHRKNALTDSTELTDTIIADLIAHPHQGLIDRQIVIDTTLKILKRFDPAAATYYQAHHLK